MAFAGVAVGQLRRFKFPVALFAVAGLLANLIVAALCCVPAGTNSALADFPVDLLGAPLLCSGHGADAASSDGAPDPKPPAKPCPICMTSVAVALLVVALTFVLALVPARNGRFVDLWLHRDIGGSVAPIRPRKPRAPSPGLNVQNLELNVARRAWAPSGMLSWRVP